MICRIRKILRLPEAPGRELVPVVRTRYDRWTSRVMEGQLDFWGENWADLSGTQQYAEWQQLIQSRGGPADPQYYMTRGLLAELLYAAAGVERELGQLTDAIAQVQLAADNVLAGQDMSAADWPEHGHHISTEDMRQASYIFINLLSWARAVRERTIRRYKSGSSEQAGLLPALAPGSLRDTVENALQTLDNALGESRFLANYALHAGAVPGGGTPRAEILPDGRILARIPDPSTSWILSWDQFEFTQNRDMLTYGQELMAAIDIFVDDILGAFEANRPARVGGPPGRATGTPLNATWLNVMSLFWPEARWLQQPRPGPPWSLAAAYVAAARRRRRADGLAAVSGSWSSSPLTQ